MLIQEIQDGKCLGNSKYDLLRSLTVIHFGIIISKIILTQEIQDDKCSGIFEIKFAAKLGFDLL